MKFRQLGMITFSVLLFSSVAKAQSFTLQDNASGATYQCGIGGGNGGGGTDPNCVSSVSDYCNKNTSYTSTDCFNKSSAACKGAGVKFADCVSSTATYCNSNTANTWTKCFDLALGSCAGSDVEMQSMMESVRLEAVTKALANKK